MQGILGMGNLRYPLIILLLLFTSSIASLAQEIVALPGGVLQQDDKAEVTGDYVRVRTGPSLEHRILTKVNQGTPVTVVTRDENLVTIQGIQNYWYRIRLDKSGIEGWMFGHYLEKRDIPLPKEERKAPILEEPISFDRGTSLGPQLPVLDDRGTIEEPESLTASGDLNGNGIDEIILLNGEDRSRSYTLVGYESGQNRMERPSLTEAYRLAVRAANVHSFEVFSGNWLEFPLVVVNATPLSQIFSVDEQRNTLRFMYKTDSPLLSMGSLDGAGRYLVYLKRNRVPENDGTITYYIHAASFDTTRGRLTLGERISYALPLPVKKMVTFDLNGDGKAEIICEIGGREQGGGIVILGLGEKGLERIVNSGFLTYKDEQFLKMWGARVHEKPRLVLYTTDPDSGNDAGTSFGFLTASLNEQGLTVDRFYPVNKLLDDVNNFREALLIDTGKDALPFLLMDLGEDKSRYTLRRPLYE
jgi:hypothetical protein